MLLKRLVSKLNDWSLKSWCNLLLQYSILMACIFIYWQIQLFFFLEGGGAVFVFVK